MNYTESQKEDFLELVMEYAKAKAIYLSGNEPHWRAKVAELEKELLNEAEWFGLND